MDTGDWSAGVVSGAVFAFNARLSQPDSTHQAQHIEFLLASLIALDALLSKPNARRAAALALWGVLQALTSMSIYLRL